MKEISQLEKTGLGANAFNPYQGRIYAHRLGGMQRVIEHSRQYPIKKYEERFPPTDYLNVVNDKNRQRVTQYDELAERANKKLTLDDCTIEEFVGIVKKATEMVYDDPKSVAQLREIFPGIEI